MRYYQSVFKQCGITLITGILVAFIVSGCVARKAENAAPTDSEIQETPAERIPKASCTIEDISVNTASDQLEVWIKGSRPLEYTSVKQEFPFAVSVYLTDTVLSPDFVPVSLSDDRVSSIKTTYADKDQTTVKVEILLNQDLTYVVKKDENRLGIILQGSTGASDVSPQDDTPKSSLAKQTGISQEPMTHPPLVIPNTPAKLTQISFDTQETGNSDIRIQTSHPVKYATRQVSDDELHLILYNTKIPLHQQRSLLTRYFNSAVERVDPKPYPGKDGDTRIDIKIREQVPFRVVQTQAGIHLSFDPSSVQPPEFVKAKVNLNKNEPNKILSSGSPNMTPGPEDAQKVRGSMEKNLPGEEMITEDIDSLTGMRKKQYTGEKIQLDFYDTDIKNVFRILKSVSGLNFAIDSDVQGKVTLSLDHPVPWDQVMDLVLKMNQLGKKREGNVYRIATLETIEKEETQLQAAIKARKESMEQKRSLEPMFTEYIPIAYTTAQSLVCHIVPTMSESENENELKIKCGDTSFNLRGSISIDERTNMIVLTDTREKIDKAYEIINELDRVTPQIVIEAKVVEVTKELSRTIGLNWNLSNASTTTGGFVDDFDVAVNKGDSVGANANFSFFRLFGSSVTALNARLEASEQLGDARIISSPRILTLDNKKAMIKQGQEYAYLERDDSGGSTVKFKNIDLLLEVTPHVTPDKRISMTVRVTKNEVVDLTPAPDNYPILGTNEAETELLVNNHDTVVIGGVVKTTQREGHDGIPFLQGIPVLGYLFSTKTKADNRNELLIFLTPSIVQLEQKRRGATHRASNVYEN